MLIEACEAIERNEDVLKATKSKEEASQIKHSVEFFSAKANYSLGENQSRITSQKILVTMGTTYLIAQQTFGL
jgi:hypothetical protein